MKRILALLLAMLVVGPVFAQADCVKTGEVCVEPNTTRNINGVSIFRECWRWQDTYQCRSATTISNCQPLRDRGCTQLGSTCIDRAPDGSCSTYDQSYRCPVTPERVVERNVCGNAFCQGDGSTCFDTSRPADRDFGQAAAMMEAAREAGIYGVDPARVEIFKGYLEECSVATVAGQTIRSCCEGTGGGAQFSNYNVIGRTAVEAAGAVASEEIKAGSRYVYDALFQAQDAGLVTEGIEAAGSGLSSGAAEGVASQSGTSFGAYGFEFSYSASGGFQFVGFDPVSFAFAVAIAVITEWLSCDQEEQVMRMKRGQGLCAYINSYCASNTLGVCTTVRQRHCCFNSMLAKLINRQGREQLGMPMNECGGFTQEQLQAIDFSRIDFSEFIATIVPRDVNPADLEERVRDTVNERVGNYFED